MTQEEKEILIKDICSRLPYGVKAIEHEYEPPFKIVAYDGSVFIDEDGFEYMVENIKPFLYPLTALTKEQENECQQIKQSYYYHDDAFILFDFYNKNNIDYRGLIPMGLAIDVTKHHICIL